MSLLTPILIVSMVATSTRRAYLRTNHQRLRNFTRLQFSLPGPAFPRLLQQTLTQMIAWCAYPACIFATCIEALLQVCGIRPKHPPYPTCGLTCAAKLKASGGSYPTRSLGSTGSPSYLGGSNNSGGSSYSSSLGGSSPMCVVSTLSLSITEYGLSFYIWAGLWCSPKLFQWNQKVSDVRPDLQEKI